MTDRAAYMKAMFFQAGAGLMNQNTLYLLVSHLGLLVVATIGSMSWVKHAAVRCLPEGTARREMAEILFIIVLFVGCLAMLVNSSYNPFLYFRF